MNSTCSNSPFCSKNISVHSHLLVKFQKHRKRWQKHLATSRNENAVQLRKHSVEIVEKHHAHGVDKRRQTSPQKRSHQNSSQIHLLSRLHQVQMNFTENEVLFQKVDVKHHHPKITKSPCFCIQIQMSPHRSASFPEFCPTVLSKTSIFVWSVPGAFRLVTTLRLTRGPAGNRTTTGNALPTTPQGRLYCQKHQSTATMPVMHGSVYFHINPFFPFFFPKSISDAWVLV